MIMTKKVSSFLLIAALFLPSCAPIIKPAFTYIVNQRPEKRLKSYAFDPTSTLISRVQETPDFLLTYLKDLDKKNTYTSYRPTSEEMTMIEEYLAKLPLLHQRVLKERLVNIYFVNNFQGSGMVDYVLDDHNELYTIMIINPETMRHDMTAWMTYRESTIYKADDQLIGITVDCGKEYTGLMYALLHETSHVVDYIMNFTPYPDPDIRLLRNTQKETEFVKDIWADLRRPAARDDYPDRKDITLYGFRDGPRLSLNKAVSLYEWLSESPFASLQSSVNWAEDFAEYVTWYHFTNKLGQPYTIIVRERGATIKNLRPMASVKVQKRENAIRGIYNDESALKSVSGSRGAGKRS